MTRYSTVRKKSHARVFITNSTIITLQLNINVLFKTLSRLEVALISKRFLFKKIDIIPDTWKSFPKVGRSSEEVNLKTLMFQEQFFFEPTSLEKMFDVLRHLSGND